MLSRARHVRRLVTSRRDRPILSPSVRRIIKKSSPAALVYVSRGERLGRNYVTYRTNRAKRYDVTGRLG